MANKVSTTFSVNTSAAITQLRNYEQQLRNLIQLQNQIAKQSAGGGPTMGTASSKPKTDPAMRAAMADIAKMERDRQRMERDATKAIEREAKAQAQAKIREAKRSANEMIAELKRIEREKARSGAGGASSPFGMGLGPVGNILGVASVGAAVGLAFSKTIEIYGAAIEKTIAAEKANRLLSASALEAGKSYSYLADQNDKFAKAVGLSATQAATTTSQIARLATYAGNASAEQIERLLKSFADLGAARGIASKDLEVLIGTILSGQDEGLNRLGISDPGQLQKAYAKEIGKTVDQLTQYEKVQAAVNAVIDKASLYQGAAAARMAGFEGKVASAEAAWNTFTESLSKALVNNPDFQNTLSGLTRLLELYSAFMGPDPGRQLAGMLDQPEGYVQAWIRAQSQRDPALSTPAALRPFGFAYRFANYMVARQSGDPGAMGSAGAQLWGRLFGNQDRDIAEAEMYQRYNALLLQRRQAEIQNEEEQERRRQAQRQVEIANLKKYYEDLNVVRDRNYELRLARIRAQIAGSKEEELAQTREVNRIRQSQIEEQIIQAEQQAQNIINRGGLKSNEVDELRLATKQKTRELQHQLNLLIIEGNGEIARKEKEVEDDRKKRLEERTKNLSSLADILRSTAAAGNPFVQILDSTAKQLEKVTELTKDLGPTFGAMGRQAVRELEAINLFTARLQGAVRAVNLRAEAETFDRPDPARQYKRENFIEYQLASAGWISWQDYEQGRQQREKQMATDAIARRYDQAEVQSRVDRMLDAINSVSRPDYLSEYEARRRRDQAIIEATQGEDPLLLSDRQRREAADARRREAEATLREESKAREDLSIIRQAIEGGVSVKLAPGYENIVRIINQATGFAEVRTNYTGANTNAAYS